MFNATLEAKVKVTPDLYHFFIRPDAGVPEFTAGQYVALGLPGSAQRAHGRPNEDTPSAPDKLIKRAYSIGSSPLVREHIEFYIAIVPQGALTPRLEALEPGDRLFIANKITGHFTLEAAPADANYVFVSTGTGIAPFMSMLRTPATWDRPRTITIVHGVRYPSDLAYREELEVLAERHEGFTYHPIVSRESPEWRGLRGHVQKVFEMGLVPLDPVKDHVFLCGNPAMIESLKEGLGQRGYIENTRKHPGSLHIESYW